MSIKEFLKPTNKFMLYWLVLGVVVLTVGGAVWWSWSENLEVNNIETVENIESNLCGPEPPAKCSADMRLTCVNGEWSCKETEEKAVFYSQEECEQKTGKSCDFQTCDFIPSGKTFEETCGKDFKKGWIPKRSVLDQAPPEKQKIIGKITFSDIEGGCWGFQGDSGERFLIGGDDKSEEIKKIPDILSKNVEIQGKIEKDIVSYCPVGDGLFKLESYRIIEDSKLDSYKGCGVDSDCKLIYDSCDCEAVNTKNTQTYLPSHKYVCEVNNCTTYNTTAVCENNQCIKKNNY